MNFQSFVNNPVKVGMFFLGLVLLGWLSWRQLPLNLFPDARTPRISVVVETKGLTPGEAERRLTADLERQLSSIKGVAGIVSYSREGSIAIQVDFHWGSDMELAYLDVKRNIGVFEVNPDVESVDVFRFDPNAAPLMTLAFTGEVDRLQITSFIDNVLQPRLEMIKGVAHVKANGVRRAEVEVALDEDVMAGYRLTPEQVMEAINRHNISTAGGVVIDGETEMLLKFVSRFRDVEEIGRCVVTVIEGHPIHLEELGRLKQSATRDEILVHQDGRRSISLDIYREPDANAVLTARGVREIVERLNQQGDYDLKIAVDRSREVERTVESLVNAGLVGMGLAVLVLLVFLRNFFGALITGLAIPISIVATFSLMYFQGLSLNLMTLGGLALASGMLVDNAIVVIENVFRHRQEGAAPKQAAVVATREVAAAIVASTLTTIVVFVPLVYVHGIAGILFRDQALMVVYSLAVSLLVALVLIPMLAARIPKGTTAENGPLSLGYGALLRSTLRARWFLLAFFVFALFIAWRRGKELPVEFFPEAVGERLSLALEMPPGTSLEATEQAVGRVEDFVLSLRYRDKRAAPLIDAYEGWRLSGEDALFLRRAQGELTGLTRREPNHPLIDALGSLVVGSEIDTERRRKIVALLDPMIVIQSLTTTIGSEEGDLSAADETTIHGPHTARMDLVLNAETLKELSAADLVEPLRAETGRVAGLSCRFESRDEYLQQLLGRSRGDVVVEVHAERLDDLRGAAELARQCFDAQAELRGTRTNLAWGEEQYVFEPDEDALTRAGIGIDDLSAQIEAYLSGKRTEELKLTQGEMAIAVVNARAASRGLEGLLGLQVMGAQGGGRDTVANLTRVRRERSAREIMRVGQERTLLVMADLAAGARYDRTMESLRGRLDEARWPPGAGWNVSVEETRRRESFDRLLFALAIAIILVYMTIAAILESVVHPFTIMISVPFALVGVVVAFELTGVSINLMGLIGMVMLAGIVVNNAIVLLDRVRQLRQEGCAAPDALVIASKQRFRPILLTSLTTVLALVPLAMGLGSGVELRRPLAVAVIGGLTGSTLLTLVILPAIYLCVEDAIGVLSRRKPARGAETTREG